MITYDLKQLKLRIGLPNKLCGKHFYEVIIFLVGLVKCFEKILFIFSEFTITYDLKKC